MLKGMFNLNLICVMGLLNSGSLPFTVTLISALASMCCAALLRGTLIILLGVATYASTLKG